MFVVDTNILLHAAIKELPHHHSTKELIEGFRRKSFSWYSTWGIFYEFLRVSTHRAVFKKPLSCRQAWDFLKIIFNSPGFSLLTETENHHEIIESLISLPSPIAGNLWHDVHIIALMMENGIRDIYTFDSDFHRFSSIRILNPLAS